MAMVDATPLPFDLPPVRRKKFTHDFDGGNQSSDAGLLLLRAAEANIGVIAAMADALPDRRDPTRVGHRLTEIIGAPVFGAKCGRRRIPITVEGGHAHGNYGHLKMAA
jgi:hypothetical protein